MCKRETRTGNLNHIQLTTGGGGGGSDEGTYKIRCPGKGGHLS